MVMDPHRGPPFRSNLILKEGVIGPWWSANLLIPLPKGLKVRREASRLKKPPKPGFWILVEVLAAFSGLDVGGPLLCGHTRDSGPLN